MLRIRCSIFVVGVVSRLDRGNNTQNPLFYTCDRCCQQTRQRKQYLEFVVLYLWQVLSVDQIEETMLRIRCSILVVGVVSRLDRGTILRILCSILVVGVVSRLDRGNNSQNPLFYTCGRCCQQTRQRKQYLESFVLYLCQVLSVDQIEETILIILCSILVVDVVSRLDRGSNTQNPLFYTCDRCCQQTRQRKQYLESFVLYLWQVLSVDQIEETILRILCSILVVGVFSRLDRGNNAQNPLLYACGRCCQQTRQGKQCLEFFVLYLWQMLSVDQIGETMLRILCSILVVGVVSRLDRGNNTQNSLFYTCGRWCQQTRQRKQYLESFVLYLWQMLSVDQIDRGNNTQNSLFYSCGRCCQQTRQRNNSQNPLFYTCGRCCQQTRQRKQYLESFVLYL